MVNPTGLERVSRFNVQLGQLPLQKGPTQWISHFPTNKYPLYRSFLTHNNNGNSDPTLLRSHPKISYHHPKSDFYTPQNRRRLSISASAIPPAATATLYELLTVPKTAVPDEIRAAFRRQARQWHPDVCPSSSDQSFFAEQFIRAREAYEVLSDPDLRQDYDLALGAGVPHGRCFQTGADRSGTRSGGGFGDWESQLEGLERRSAARTAAAATSP